MRIEYEGYESRQLASMVGRLSEVPGRENRVDYIMMRTPKKNVEQ